MTPSLKISEKLIYRLEKYGNVENFGKLYGILAKNQLAVLGLQLELNDDRDSSHVFAFPAEVDICGIIEIKDEDYDEAPIKKRLNHVDVTDNPVFLHFQPTSKKLIAYYYVNEKLESTSIEYVSVQEILDNFLYIRLEAPLSISCEFSYDAIKDCFLNLCKMVSSGTMAFKFQRMDIYLLGNDYEILGMSGDNCIGDLCDFSEPGEGSYKKQKSYTYNILSVEMLKRVTSDGPNTGKKHAPICIIDKKQYKTISLIFRINTLTMVHRHTKITELYPILVESAIRNLRLCEKVMLKHLNEDSLSQPEAFHFYSKDLGHFVTTIYLKKKSDDNLYKERRLLHEQFLLPMDYPQFRRTNCHVFTKQENINGPLMNPHEHVKATNHGGKICLVKGKYLYYHYCQNQMDDSSWGCAYRSLQTLASWFILQGYSNKDVPDFQQIQECLVDIGDKSVRFLGSRQWIGSTEVNFVLNSLLGIVCKILYITSGEDMETKGPELVNHFETNGSPIMIGGGRYAYTILGVDYNSRLGSIKFLILDPHYVGPEDIHTIISKGYCAWKDVNFWDKTEFYNMCLPQVPRGI